MPVDTSMVDILTIAQRYSNVSSKRVALTHGGEFTGPCPLCGGGENRFLVWPRRPRDAGPSWWCRVCRESGDIIKLVQLCEQVSFREACDILDVDPGSQYDYTAPARIELPTDPPCKQWQEQAMRVIGQAHLKLGKPGGASALAYLRGRGFTDDIIRSAKIGYIPNDSSTGSWRCESFENWGLNADDYPGKDGVWLPEGILIPWLEGDEIVWKLNIRRFSGLKEDESRYREVIGSRAGLYNFTAIRWDAPVVLCESELDVLSGIQTCGDDRAVFVATGSTSRGRDPLWVAHVNKAPYTLIAFDDDENDAGDKAAPDWQRVLCSSFRWLPWKHDLNDMLISGVDIRTWAALGIEAYEASQERVAPQSELIPEPEQPAPVITPIVNLAGFVPLLPVITPAGPGRLWEHSPVRMRMNGEYCVAVLLDTAVHSSERQLEYFSPTDVQACTLPDDIPAQASSIKQKTWNDFKHV